MRLTSSTASWHAGHPAVKISIFFLSAILRPSSKEPDSGKSSALRLLDRRARELTEGLALLAAGTILRAHAPPAVADAFIATRLQGPVHHTYGQGLEGADTRAIVDRAWPG